MYHQIYGVKTCNYEIYLLLVWVVTVAVVLWNTVYATTKLKICFKNGPFLILCAIWSIYTYILFVACFVKPLTGWWPCLMYALSVVYSNVDETFNIWMLNFITHFFFFSLKRFPGKTQFSFYSFRPWRVTFWRGVIYNN